MISRKTRLSVDELDVVRTLRVAVTGTVLGTSFVVGELGHTTILVHLDEVDGTVQATTEVGHVNVETELLILQLEELVSAVVLEEVDTRADVAASDELEGKSVTGRGDTVGTGVVGTIKSAVLRAGLRVRTKGSIPLVTGVAVGETAGGVQPTPVGVEHDGGLGCGTPAALCTVLRGEFGMVLGLLCADLLAVHRGEE